MDSETLKRNFTYHPPVSESQVEDYQEIRSEGYLFAELINATVPESREKSLALTKIEEAVMWANAGIARNA